MPARIELEVYCDECNSVLEAEVTGNAIMVKICEQCLNLHSMVDVEEAIRGERAEPTHEGIEESSPSEVRAGLEGGDPKVEALEVVLRDAQEQLNQLKERGGE